MSAINDIKEVLHRIRVRLFPNNLPGSKNTYYARTANEAELTVEEVAAAKVNRGGFTGNYHDLVSYAREFLHEAAYQLCDGYAVNLGYFSIHPVVGGFFASENEDPRDHPVRFRFRARKPLRELARYIVVEADSVSDAGFIGSFIDIDSGETNALVTPGGIFTVTGRKIKISGDSPDCGLYFVSKADAARRFKVARRFAVNVNTKVSGIVPPLSAGEYFIEIVTQYTVGGIDLKQPRTVASAFSVRVGG